MAFASAQGTAAGAIDQNYGQVNLRSFTDQFDMSSPNIQVTICPWYIDKMNSKKYQIAADIPKNWWFTSWTMIKNAFTTFGAEVDAMALFDLTLYHEVMWSCMDSTLCVIDMMLVHPCRTNARESGSQQPRKCDYRRRGLWWWLPMGQHIQDCEVK